MQLRSFNDHKIAKLNGTYKYTNDQTEHSGVSAQCIISCEIAVHGLGF